MIIEYIRYDVPEDRAAEFEAAYAEGGKVLDQDPHCEGYEVTRGIEEPNHFVVRIAWDSVTGHEQGFRRSPGFRTFFAAVKPFFEQILEMKHYELRTGSA